MECTIVKSKPFKYLVVGKADFLEGPVGHEGLGLDLGSGHTGLKHLDQVLEKIPATSDRDNDLESSDRECNGGSHFNLPPVCLITVCSNLGTSLT